MIDDKKKAKAINTVFIDHDIIGATIASRHHIAFATREIQWMTEEELDDDDSYEKGPDELRTWLITYHYEELGYKGGFSASGVRGVRRILPVILFENNISITLGLYAQGNYKGLIDEYSDIHNMDDKNYIATPIPLPHYSMWSGATIENHIYFAGTPRVLYKRLAPGKWINLTDRETYPHMFTDIVTAESKSEDGFVDIRSGFHAVDGFTENDLYAGGEQGDCWHYDGKNWRALDLPTNSNIRSICCAPDGQVYIGGSMGTLLKGRLGADGERWQKIKFADSPSEEDFRSLAWFQGRLWLGGWNGTYRLEQQHGQPVVQRYVFPDGGAKQFSFSGGVCSCDEALMAWGESQVLLYDGERWTNFLISDMSVSIPDDVAEALQTVAEKQQPQ